MSQPHILFACTTIKYQPKCYISTSYAWESPEEPSKNISGLPTAYVTSKTIHIAFLKNNSYVNSRQTLYILRAIKIELKKTYLVCMYCNSFQVWMNFTL